MQKPSIGRVVIARVDPAQNNGTDLAPAIITRVWNDTLVNLRIFVDTPAAPLSKTSATLGEDDASGAMCWWPPRV